MNTFLRTAIALVCLSFGSVANATLASNIIYNSCDFACTNPTTISQQTQDNSALSFGDTYGSAFAQADYGVLKVDATSTFVSFGIGSFLSESSSSGGAAWNDQISFLGGSGSGTANVVIHIDGSYGVAGDTQPSTSAGMNFTFLFNGQMLSVSMDTVHGTSNVHGAFDGETLTGSFAFDYGQLYGLSGALDAQGAFSGFSHFGNTVTLEFLLPEGASVLSVAGATYQVGGADTPIPEPATFSLLALGLAGLRFARRRLHYSIGLPRVSCRAHGA